MVNYEPAMSDYNEDVNRLIHGKVIEYIWTLYFDSGLSPFSDNTVEILLFEAIYRKQQFGI